MIILKVKDLDFISCFLGYLNSNMIILKEVYSGNGVDFFII